jgi:hypothetical protein
MQIKGKLDLLSLQDDLKFVELKIEEEMDEEIVLELERERKKILDRIQSIDVKPSVDSLHSSSRKSVELKESAEFVDDVEHVDERNACAKNLSKAFSCVGESFRRSLRISKPQPRCKSQDPCAERKYSPSEFKHYSESFEKSLSEETIVSSVNSHSRSKSASFFESLRDRELQVVIYTGNQEPKGEKVKMEEMNLVLDCACEVIEEVFHLSAPTNWLRSQGLYLVKTLVRSAYGSVISEIIQKTVAELLKEDTICFFLDTIREYVWPNDDFAEPNAEEKAQTKSEAWKLLMEQNPSETKLGIGIYRIQTIVGKYNTIIGLTRLFNMLQHEALNRILAFRFLEALIDHSCIQ